MPSKVSPRSSRSHTACSRTVSCGPRCCRRDAAGRRSADRSEVALHHGPQRASQAGHGVEFTRIEARPGRVPVQVDVEQPAVAHSTASVGAAAVGAEDRPPLARRVRRVDRLAVRGAEVTGQAVRHHGAGNAVFVAPGWLAGLREVRVVALHALAVDAPAVERDVEACAARGRMARASVRASACEGTGQTCIAIAPVDARHGGWGLGG